MTISQLCPLYVDCQHDAITNVTTTANLEQHVLAMQLAIGCYSRRTQEKLLQETKVNLEHFVCIMQTHETAALSSAAALHNETTGTTVAATFRGKHTFDNSKKRSTSQQQRRHPPTATKACLGCGKIGHIFKSADCPATGKTCRHYSNLNHFATACLRKAKEQKTVHLLQVGTVSSLTSGHTPEIFTELSVSCDNAAALLRSMVDTGANISTM